MRRQGRNITTLFALAVGITSLPASVNARATGVKTLTDVAFEATEDALRFEFAADAPLSAGAISAHRPEKRVVSFRVDAADTSRRWLKFGDAQIKRTLLHPSRRERAAVLRIRMNADVSQAMLENVRVRAEDGRLVVLMPRSTAVAQRWALPEPVVEATQKTVLPPTVVEPEAEAVAEPTPAEAAAPVAEAVADAPVEAAPASEPAVAPIGEATPLALGETAGAEAETPVAAGLSSPEGHDGPGMGVVAMSFLFVGFIGFILWRKNKAQNGDRTGGPLIKPVGTHLLGPKQSLLLVDVAGEMVLLGTTDKGVQMLTKIESAVDEAKTPRRPVAVTPSETPVPAEVLGEPEEAAAVPGRGFADKLGRAFSRIREAARGPEVSSNELERDFFARSKVAVQEAAEDDALQALISAADDEADPVEIGRSPARTSTPAPDMASADLLEKIRRLQSA